MLPFCICIVVEMMSACLNKKCQYSYAQILSTRVAFKFVLFVHYDIKPISNVLV